MNNEPFQVCMRSLQELNDVANSRLNAIVMLQGHLEILLKAAIALRNNVDVSTINNSKRTTAQWSELATDFDRVRTMIEAQKQNAV